MLKMLNLYRYYDKPKELNPALSDKCPTDILVGYAVYVLKRRYPDAEPIIMKDPLYAYIYARDILARDPVWVNIPGHEKGRWPDAEPNILKDKSEVNIYLYAREVIHGRWPEAEPRILTFKNLRIIIDYVDNVINIGKPTKAIRWPEAEAVIKYNAEKAYEYAVRIIRGRFEEAEPYIMKKPACAFDYWQKIINLGNTTNQFQRWEEAEPYIKTKKLLWKKYKSRFPEIVD